MEVMHEEGIMRTYEWQSDNILNWNKSLANTRFAVTGLVNAESNQSWFTRFRNFEFFTH